MESKTIILIPARLDSSRLPNKALADIGDVPMVIRVAHQAMKSKIKNIVIASGDEEIINCAKNYNIEAVKTYKTHSSGSDRIYEALCSLDKEQKFEFIINLQGDLPNIHPDHINKLLHILETTKAEIASLGALLRADINDPNIVKIIGSKYEQQNILKAIYFTRAPAPYGDGPYYEHIGIYAYRRRALEKFIALPPSELEQREKLEQLRAIENNMSINIGLVDGCPISVDTESDLKRARQLLA